MKKKSALVIFYRVFPLMIILAFGGCDSERSGRDADLANDADDLQGDADSSVDSGSDADTVADADSDESGVGVDSDVDSTNDAETEADADSDTEAEERDVLFESAFNSTTSLGAPYSVNDVWVQDITGGDLGYDWETDLPGTGNNVISYNVCDTHTLSDYILAEIIPGIDHIGATSNLLHINVVDKTGSCGYGPPYYTASRFQFNLVATGSTSPDDLMELCVVRWQKLASNFQENMSENKYAQLFESIYSADGSWKLDIKRLSGDLFWSLEDRQPGDPAGSDWMNTDVEVPQGEWFKISIYVNYNFGSERFLFKVNDTTIFDITSETHAWYVNDVDFHRFIAFYTDDTSGLETWISRVEIYDSLIGCSD